MTAATSRNRSTTATPTRRSDTLPRGSCGTSRRSRPCREGLLNVGPPRDQIELLEQGRYTDRELRQHVLAGNEVIEFVDPDLLERSIDRHTAARDLRNPHLLQAFGLR